MTHTRRTFLATLGVAAFGIASKDARAAAAALTERKKIKKIGLQLYSVRDLMKADLEGTLRQVASIGYKEVEFAGYFGRTPAQIRQLLRQNKLTSPSTHVGLDALEKDGAPKTFANAKAIGHEWVTLAWLPEDRRKPDDWKRFADAFNKWGRQAKAADVRFAYHNHDFEFKPANGVLGYETLLNGTDPKLVNFEMDLYWVKFAGGNPIDLFNRHPHRFKLAHVKDSAGPPDNKMVDVGQGKIDFRSIFAQSGKAGFKHYFVEHDQPADPIATIRNSYNYLASLNF